MTFYSYEDMLNKAMEKLPKKMEKKDRFEIPEVICIAEGNKTLFKNFGDILSVLRRDAKHLSKYLLKELATPGTVQGGTLILQRRVSGNMIQDKITTYVKEFVYCKECGEPDTKIIREDRVSFLVCEACGCRYPLRSF
jgi:translation initiation factor 2 subunit 2